MVVEANARRMTTHYDVHRTMETVLVGEYQVRDLDCAFL